MQIKLIVVFYFYFIYFINSFTSCVHSNAVYHFLIIIFVFSADTDAKAKTGIRCTVFLLLYT